MEGVPGPGAQVLKEAQRGISKVKQASKKSKGQFPDSPKGLLRLVLALRAWLGPACPLGPGPAKQNLGF